MPEMPADQTRTLANQGLIASIDSPYFRGALSFALIWISVWMYLSYRHYQEAYQDPALFDAFSNPLLIDQCYYDKTELSGDDWITRRPTVIETSKCISEARVTFRTQAISSNRESLFQSIQRFLQFGILPSLILLAIISFRNPLRQIILRTWQSYFDWLRFGSNNRDV